MNYLDAITFTITSVYSTLDEDALKELSEFLRDKAGGIDLHLKERAEEKVKTFSTDSDKIDYLEQVISDQKKELKVLRRELALCQEQIMKQSQK